MKKILVFRLSAIGDIAMTVPVIWSLSEAYPDAEITFVSQKIASNFLQYLPRVTFVEAELKGRHKGLWGIFRLYLDLRKRGHFDVVADLHDVIRTKLIRFFYRFSASKIVVIDKGRKDKRALCSIKNKKLKPLETTSSRYVHTLQRAGFNFDINFQSLFVKSELSDSILQVTGTPGKSWIGIAPFAKHKGKIYPLVLMEEVLQNLCQIPDVQIFLFGGGANEVAILEGWSKRFPNTISLAGKLKMDEELRVIAHLKVLLTMDSANMHFASLVNTPVVSIWGATHPYAGFYGLNQDINRAIQIDLPCRPCSIFGNKACFRKDYACMYQIKPETISSKIISEALL